MGFVTVATKNKILNKLERLPNEVLLEVEDLIDFLKAKIEKKNVDSKTLGEPKSIHGAAKGLFIIPDDFNKPLDDFKGRL